MAGIRRSLAAVLATATFALAAASAGVADSGPPPDGPDLAAMALSTSDLHANNVDLESYTTVAGMRTYYRAFGGPVHVLSGPLDGATNVEVLLADGDAAQHEFALARRSLRLPAQRASFARAMATIFMSASKLKVTKPTAGALRTLGFGDESAAFTVTLKLRKGVARIGLGLVRIDRVIGYVALLDLKHKIRNADVDAATALFAKHAHDGLVIGSVAGPSVPAAPAQGQWTTADRGRWSGGPSAFEYQWSRCDASGAACAPIDGATKQPYAVTAADAGYRLEVTITATNGVSTLSETSAASGVVT